MNMNRKIILASQSPRRRELLAQAGFLYEVKPSQIEEVITKVNPWEVVMELSQQKAEDVYIVTEENKRAILVIGADTVVAYGNRILGKPHSEEEAYEMLQMLQGNTHQVYTGVTLVWNELGGMKSHTFYEETAVTLYPMTDAEIYQYIATGDYRDKAGGYGIQTHFGVHVQGIQGDYNNVVGLPIARLYQEMKQQGLIMNVSEIR